MRRSFSDGSRLRRRAQRNHDLGLHVAERWWTSKFELPPSDPRFLSMSRESVMTAMYEDLLSTREGILEELETSRRDNSHLYERLSGINKILDGEDRGPSRRFSPDPLIDKWERELAEGTLIDLEEKLPQGRGGTRATPSE